MVLFGFLRRAWGAVGWLGVSFLLTSSVPVVDIGAAFAAEPTNGYSLVVGSERAHRRNPAPYEDVVEERTFRLWIGARFVRQDLGDAETQLLDRRERRLYLVDHRSRSWQEYPVPVRIEDHLTAEEAGRLALHARRLGRLEAAPATMAEIGEWTTTRSGWSATLETVTVEVSWWLARLDGVDSAAYWDLVRNVAALHPIHREWMAAIEPPRGLPVRQILEAKDERFEETREWQVRSIEVVTPAEDVFSVPDGYRRKPSRCFRDLSFGDDPACR